MIKMQYLRTNMKYNALAAFRLSRTWRTRARSMCSVYATEYNFPTITHKNYTLKTR